jgi:hypothetical protein
MLSRCFLGKLSYLPSIFLALMMNSLGDGTAQIPNFEQVGLPQNSTILPVSLGGINLANGSIHLELPLVSQPEQGGATFTAKLVFNSASWQYRPSFGVIPSQWINFTPASWFFTTSGTPGELVSTIDVNVCQPAEEGAIYSADDQYSFGYTEPNGTTHFFSGVATYYNIGTDPVNYPCDVETPSASGYSDDGSGFFIKVSNYDQAIVYAADGTQVYPRIEDRNGNVYSTDSNGNVINTLGVIPVLVSSDSGHQYFDVVNPPGSPQPTSRYTATLETISINIPSGPNYAGQTQTVQTIQSISRPDNTSYSFSDDSWGTLQSVTLPTGGTEQFGYSVVADSNAHISMTRREIVSQNVLFKTGTAILHSLVFNKQKPS